jgi:hypothetical protein
VAELPEEYTVIRLCDNLFAASALFAQTASSAANTMGYDTVISKAVDTENSPMHLIIPEIRTAFLSESEIFKNKSAVNRKLNLNRFYIPEFLEARAHSSEFCGECIKKLLDEAALYARICMDIKNQGRRLIEPYISEKDLSDIASEIVYTIMNQGN